MKRFLLLIATFGLLVGCNRTHPVKIFVDPSMETGQIEKIAVFPFASSLPHMEDPDNKAPSMMDRLFLQELGQRRDYKFSSPSSVKYALEGEGLTENATRFIDNWRQSEQVDAVFLKQIAERLQVDAVLIGVVDLWQKDEVDYQENAAAATYVGATVTIFRAADGAILFKASDEDFAETARSEERTVITSALGSVQNDQGSRVYNAPEFKEVAIKVVRALVASVPVR